MTRRNLPDELRDLLPSLWAFALRITLNTRDAEELVERAYVRGLENADGLSHGTSRLNWMLSIVYSIWTSEMQAEKRHSRDHSNPDANRLGSVSNSDVKDSRASPSIRQIIDAVQRLPETQRAVLILVTLEDLSYREAADVLNVPIRIVMRRLSRARRAIGATVRTTVGDPGAAE
jgi:RNA polymerase sigma-70 factor (ECF subfamily)